MRPKSSALLVCLLGVSAATGCGVHSGPGRHEVEGQSRGYADQAVAALKPLAAPATVTSQSWETCGTFGEKNYTLSLRVSLADDPFRALKRLKESWTMAHYLDVMVWGPTVDDRYTATAWAPTSPPAGTSTSVTSVPPADRTPR